MKTRVITGAFLVAILVPIFLLGGLYTQVLLGILTIGSIYELNKMFDSEHKINTSKFLIEGILGLSVFMSIIAHFQNGISFEYLFIVLLSSILFVLKHNTAKTNGRLYLLFHSLAKSINSIEFEKNYCS